MTSNFKMRKTAPAGTNKWFIKTYKGGYNKAVCINEKTGSCLPNCCGLVHGRWLECVGEKDYSKDKLCTGNAGSYFGYTKDGYKRSQTPEEGAIGCYSGGDGHVIFVEKKYADGGIDYSESAFNGVRYRFGHMDPPYNYKGYKFQGFIINPLIIKKEEKADALKVGDKVTIVGKGNATSTGKGKAAYGITWKRYILKVVKGAAYPYCVGFNGVATGWYKAKALKKGW